MSDLAVKLSEVMGMVGYVQKDATNDFHRYRYASAEAVLRKVNAALSSRGVAIASHAELVHHEALASGKGTMAVVRLALDFTDGKDSIHVEGLGSGMDSGDKAILKANTAALKYAVANAFLISWGDDPEADTETDKEAKERIAAAKASNEAMKPATPAESPFADGEIDLVELASRPRARAFLESWKGKKGVTDWRDCFHRAFGTLGWPEDRFFAWALEKGVDLANGAKYSDAVKLSALLLREVETKPSRANTIPPETACRNGGGETIKDDEMRGVRT